MRHGLFGGSFDPPHVGHIETARRARAAFDLRRVTFVVAAWPPHKGAERRASFAHRAAMTRLAVSDLSWAEVDESEAEREGPSYTIHTLQDWRRRAPEDELFFIIGSDSLAELPYWHRISEALEAARFVTVARDGFDETIFERLAAALGEKAVERMRRDTIRLEPVRVSSTEVRRRIAAGEPWSELVPPCVARYVRDHNLYATRRPS